MWMTFLHKCSALPVNGALTEHHSTAVGLVEPCKNPIWKSKKRGSETVEGVSPIDRPSTKKTVTKTTSCSTIEQENHGYIRLVYCLPFGE